MAKEWMPGVCNETAGFLFSHDCMRPPQVNCERCGKPVCGEHSRQEDGQVFCVGCVRKRSSRHRGMRGGHHRDHYYHDPYFYGGYYYYAYDDTMSGHGYHDLMHDDPHDFTDADAESLQAGDEDFENDMGES